MHTACSTFRWHSLPLDLRNHHSWLPSSAGLKLDTLSWPLLPQLAEALHRLSAQLGKVRDGAQCALDYGIRAAAPLLPHAQSFEHDRRSEDLMRWIETEFSGCGDRCGDESRGCAAVGSGEKAIATPPSTPGGHAHTPAAESTSRDVALATAVVSTRSHLHAAVRRIFCGACADVELAANGDGDGGDGIATETRSRASAVRAHCRAERLVLRMVSESFGPKTLELLPLGVALPLLEAIRACRHKAPVGWPAQAYALLGREDLARQARRDAIARAQEAASSSQTTAGASRAPSAVFLCVTDARLYSVFR
eukprot:1526295-Pleurochrysis_carterae.AAC.1